jgi:acetate---CoA ligase (ADP-forming)
MTTCSDVSDYARSLLLPRRLSLLAGLDLGMTAIGHALWWHECRGRPARSREERTPAPNRPEWLSRQPASVWSELAGRRLLEAAGVPTVPAEVVRSADDAELAAERLGYPVVVKIHAPGVGHKSDVGGVALDLESSGAVVDAATRLLRQPGVEGVLVAPMRSGGHELLAGVTIDPTFGLVLAVGLGGVWVETLHDVVLRVLPVGPAEARAMLGELKAAPLLRGARGGAPIDTERVANVLVRVTEAAAMLGPSLRAIEVNPLWCRGRDVEALDVLVVTSTGEA